MRAKVMRLTAVAAVATGVLLGMVPAAPAMADECTETRVWMPPPFGHHLPPTVDSEQTDCTCEAPYVWVEPGFSYSTIRGCGKV